MTESVNLLKIAEEVWQLYVPSKETSAPSEIHDDYEDWSMGAKATVQALVWTIVGLIAGQSASVELIKKIKEMGEKKK